MAQVLLCGSDGMSGAALVTLPISDREYAKTLGDLRALGIGDERARDCYVDQIIDAPPALDCLEGQTVNIDELDFLMRSLDRFDDVELAGFQAMAAKLELRDIEDFINLSFCSEKATVITSFDDLESLGRRHYMNVHGTCSTEEYDSLNGVGIARGLISSGEGTVTPYGVVYDNGLQLERLYTGRGFPAYADQAYLMELELAPAADEPWEPSTFLFLPVPEERLERLVRRAGYDSAAEVNILAWHSGLPDAVKEALDMPREDLLLVNSLCKKVSDMGDFQRKTLAAAVRYAQAEGVYEVNRVAEELEQFKFTPDVNTPEEYGKYMIQNSVYLDYDPELEDFYDYKKYGEARVRDEGGRFLNGGYVRFTGTVTMEELLAKPPSPAPEPGGMTMAGF